MTRNPIILFGSGGQAKVVAAIIRALGLYEIAGVVTPDLAVGDVFCGVKVIANTEDAPALEGYELGAIAVGDGALRKKIAGKAAAFKFPVLVHPTAVVEPTAKLGNGTIVHAKAYIGVDAVIGVHGLINTGAQIDHDAVIGDYVSIAPRVVTGGKVVIGDGTFIGLGANIINDITIGAGAIIGAGTVVVRDVPASTKIFRKTPLNSVPAHG